MSGDEVIATIASIVFGPVAWIWWFASAQSLEPSRPGRRTHRSVMLWSVVACALIVERTLAWGAADDVRYAPQYVLMYLVMGFAAIRLASWCFQFAGLHSRDDLLERRNPAALPAWVGALVGVTCCYAGGNIGNGPGWWVVVFSACLATAALFLVWIAVGQRTGLVDAVILDRDPAAGWRLGGFLAAVGVIFGFAVTGDWVSAPATVVDFITRAWPVVPLAAVAWLIERAARPTVEKPRAPLMAAGVVPAVVYVALAVAAVVVQWPRP